MEYKKYQESNDYAYIFGAFGTIELLKKRSSEAICVIVDPSFVKNDTFCKIEKLAMKNNVQIIVDKKAIDKIKDKGNIYVIGVFKKYEMRLSDNKHIVLNGYEDFGLIGTIIRSMNGFNFSSLVLINDNPIDIYNEHLLRSSMGSFFNINIECFNNIDNYLQKYNNQDIYLVDKCEGKDIKKIKPLNNFSLFFTKNNEKFNYNCKKILISEDISIENIVNIVLFTLYEKS